MREKEETKTDYQMTLEQLYYWLEQMPGNYIAFEEKNKSLQFLYATNGVSYLAGYRKEEFEQILRQDLLGLVLEEERSLIRQKMGEYVRNLAFTDMNLLFRLINPRKGFIWAHMAVKRYNCSKKKTIFLIDIQDATKETMLSYALMGASERYICVIEKATKRLLYANNLFYDLINSSPSQTMGKHCYEMFCKVLAMKDNDNCLCYSSINAYPPLEIYNPDKKKYFTLTGREITWGEYGAYVFFMTDITEKKRKDQQLEDSQRRFNVALKNSELMVWEYDMVNHLCINSEKAGKEYDIPLVIENYPESLYNTGYTPPETIAQIEEVKRRLENGETDFFVERRTIDKYGKSNWQKVDYTLECDENGKPIRAIVCGLDITAKKELEQKYEEQMEYRNKFAENAMFSIRMDLDSDEVLDYTCSDPILMTIVKQNQTAKEMLEQFFRTSVFHENSGITKEDLTAHELKEAYLLGRSQYQTVYRCALLNQYMDLNLSLYKNPGNDHLEVFYVITDVTENIRSQNALASVLNKDYDFVALIHTDNGVMVTLTHSEETVVPQTIDNEEGYYDTVIMNFANTYRKSYYSDADYHSVSDGMLLSVIIKKLEEMSVYEFNCKTKEADGQIYTHRLSFSYADESGKQIIFTRANITQALQGERAIQERLEKAVQDAKKADQAKTDFLSRMSHDMRTPMNGIIGMTRLTQDIPGLPEEAQKNLAAINDSSAYLLQLINDTLDMNKIESDRFTLKPEIVHSGEMISHILATISPLAKQKKIKLIFSSSNTQLEYIRTDRVRFQQLFLNLLSNAVKFTQEGGSVRFSIECEKREGMIAYDKIVIQDNGRGMSKEFLNHIFEPFSQERNEIIRGQEGTGLGMTIVRKLVEQMGGTIQIQSEIGIGTTVTICLAFECITDLPPKPMANDPFEKSLKGKVVLLAEDHPLNATIAKRLLEKEGMKVIHVQDGQKTVEAFINAKVNAFDMILMDIRMPVMNGLEASRMIRSLNREDAKTIPIIAMTANAYDDDVQKALAIGMNAHLAKPVEPEVLYAVLRNWV